MRYLMRDKTTGLGPVMVTDDELMLYDEENAGHEITADMVITTDRASSTPNYYRLPNGGDVIDLLSDEEKRAFFKGNILKYILRAGVKAKETKVEDLKKAKDYIERFIALEIDE